MNEQIACQMYTRVTGYIRPINTFNPGKQQETIDRSYIKAEIISGN